MATRSIIVGNEEVRLSVVKDHVKSLNETTISLEEATLKNMTELKEIREEILAQRTENRELTVELKKILVKPQDKGKDASDAIDAGESRYQCVNFSGDKGILPNPPGSWVGSVNGTNLLELTDSPDMRLNNTYMGGNNFFPKTVFLPKVKLSSFEGQEPQMWLKKCVKYFDIYQVADDQRLTLASLHLMGKADTQYHNWARGRRRSWEEFETALCERFGDEEVSDVIEAFMKLRQEGSM